MFAVFFSPIFTVPKTKNIYIIWLFEWGYLNYSYAFNHSWTPAFYVFIIIAFCSNSLFMSKFPENKTKLEKKRRTSKQSNTTPKKERHPPVGCRLNHSTHNSVRELRLKQICLNEWKVIYYFLLSRYMITSNAWLNLNDDFFSF